MNVKNRRMFRPKNAGKQAAGILASSPQLMQSVQKRANGGANFKPQLASIGLQNLAGQARNLEEARNLALANQKTKPQPTFFGQQTPGAKFGGNTYGGMTFGGMTFGGRKRASSGSNNLGTNAQLASIALQNAQNRARDLEEARNLALANNTPIVDSQTAYSNLLRNKPTDTRITRGLKSITRAGDKLPSPLEIAGGILSLPVQAYNFLTEKPYDPGSASQYRPGTVPSADNTRPGPSLSAVSGLNQISGQESVPIAEGAEQLGMLPSEEIIDSSVTVDTEAPTDGAPTTEQGPQETKPVKGTPTKAMEVADGLLIKRDNQKDQDKKAASTASAPEIIQQSVNEALQTQNNPDVSPKEKAETTDELLGIVQTTEEPTRKERIEARKAMLTDLLGEDAAKDIRTDANYNLMMTGLLIAAGESPNALANIAKGAAAGLSKYGDVVGDKAVKKREREEKISLQAISDIRDEMATEDQREYDSLVRSAQQDHEVKLQDNKYINDLKLLDRKLSDAEQRQINEFEFKTELANQNLLQTFALFDLQDEQKTRLLESEMSFKKELQQLANNADSADMKMVKAIRLADKSLSFSDAYAIFKAQTGKTPTDEQQRFSRFVQGGLSPELASIYAQPGVSEQIIDELGVERGLAKLRGTDTNSKSSQQATFDGTSTTTGVPTISTQADFDALPSGAEYIDPGDGLKYRKQ